MGKIITLDELSKDKCGKCHKPIIQDLIVVTAANGLQRKFHQRCLVDISKVAKPVLGPM